MADISLLFDVAGGGQISGESGKLIQSQLTSIVSQINSEPLKIKFQADPASLNSMKTEIQKITSEIGSNSSIQKSVVDGILPGINSIVEKMSDLGVKGAAGIEQITARLTEMLGVITQISQKQLSFGNLFGGGQFKTDAQELALVKEQAKELTRVVTEMAASLGKFNLTPVLKGTNLTSPLIESLGRVKSAVDYISKIDASSGVSGVNKVISELSSLKTIFDQVLEQARSLGIAVPDIDTSKLDAATEKVESYRNELANLQKQLVTGISAGSSGGDASALEKEKASVKGLSNEYQSHSAAVEQASKAESEKKIVSDGVAAALDVESTATKESANAAKEAAEAEKKRNRTSKESVKNTTDNTKLLQSSLNTYKLATDRLSQWSKAESSVHASSREAYDALRAQTEALGEMRQRYMNGETSAQELADSQSKLKSQLMQTEIVLKKNGDAARSFGERISDLAKKFGTWFGITRIVMAVVRSIKQMVSASIELDSAFAQLKIVTGATNSEMEQFANTTIALAKDLGQSVTDVAKSIETFSRLGYNLPDASELAEYATILANVAAVDTGEATTGLTSIIKGFDMDVKDAEHVADVLVEVGQKYAVSASEMMEAYEKSGAALHATNTSFEKSAGLIAAANAAVQNSSVVGTALKTVSARIRGSISDLEELGEDTEELAEGFSKYATEIKALTGFDIMVEGTTDRFKDLYDILQGVAGVWKDLSDTQRARVSEILGGTRQLQVISSIIGNWTDAVGAYSTAMESAGAATQANNIYMDTAQAHINQFKATFEAMSRSLVSSGLVGTIADIASAVLSLISHLSSLPVLIGTVMAALSIKNVGELSNQFQPPMILRVEYAHEAFTNGNMNETMRRLAA